ncbi:hypothetical protein JCM10207_006565 [Rhodosporidiobolus poonsookiae]
MLLSRLLRPSRRPFLAFTSTRCASSAPPRSPPVPPSFSRAGHGAVVSDRMARGPGIKAVGGDGVAKVTGEKKAEEQPSRPQPQELLTVLEETIKTHGPLPISRYMTLCLQHPTLGYYTTRTVFGKEGDFVTSPEISQVFGELLGIWFVTQWLAQGSPRKVRIVELGPGKGTLLADILRTFRALPAPSRPPISSIHLIETSPALRAIQRAKLSEAGCGDVPTRWYGDVKEVPKAGETDEFTVLVAHEFFDALPIHVFEHTQKGWREVLVDVADPKSIVSPSAPRDPLRLVLAPSPTPASALYSSLAALAAPSVAHQLQPDLNSAAPKRLTPTPGLGAALNVDTTLGFPPSPPSPSSLSSSSPAPPGPAAAALDPAHSLTAQRFARLPIGSRIEVSPSSWEVARDVAALIGSAEGEAREGAGGAGLVVDYGDAKAFGRSWRGFRKHQVVDPLSEPGHTDLTANVDFSYLAEAMGDFVSTHGPLTQTRFLTSLGLQPRLAALLRAAPTEERRKEIESAARRLVDMGGMGGQYRVMGVTPRRAKEGREEEKGEGVFPFDLE